MSFGGGGFGFGSTNNTQTPFGSGGSGFGSNNNTNTNTGFGSSNTNTGSGMFGQPNTGNTAFGGGGTNNTTSSPFGGGGGGFGSGTNTSFGSKPFGASTTGNSLFGASNPATSGSSFSGFGSTANNTPAGGFGSGSTGGGMFGGQNKTGFGASATGTGTGSMFGGGNTGGTGFGSGTGGGFGASNTAGGFGTAAAATTNNGTATVPFNAFQEKDTAASGGTQHFQTITFQDPYKNFSLEELRTVDYNQGRRYGNQNGQPGAFGQSTGFGGFSANNNTTTGAFGSNSNTSSGLFGGGNNNTASAFGQNNTTSAFGNNTNTAGNGLFAQNKPAGGLFGSTPATQPSTGGLFGSTTNTNTGGTFGTGSAGFGASTTGGGMFGQANQTQNKPAFGGFGSGTTTTNTGGSLFGGSTGGGFGTNTSSNTGGGMFGQANQAAPAPGFGANQTATNTGSGLFGGANTGNSLFGQGQQNQNQPQQSGGLFGGAGSFGQSSQQNQPKPGGLFGNSTTNTTGGGLFGQNNQSQQAGGSFGNTAPQNQSGGLFGNKPAAPSTGLFGNTAQNTGTTGGGLFGGIGSQTNQQNQGSTLFGQNQQKPGGLFGNSTANTNTGNGLFSNLGQSNNNASAFGGSLFSSQNQQPQNQQSAGNSLFGASGGSSLLQTSMNTNPYGNDALFANLATPAQSPGPLATPLSSSQKNRKSAILPQHKLNPAASTRLLTPQTKRVGGYGFTYSTYGTPNSASTGSSPGFSGGLLGNSNLSKSLGRSVSNSSLRNSFSAENSILAPGAFTSTGRAHGTGSMKKLNINRNINTRMPLFEDVPDKKRVSFAGTPNGSDSGSTVSNPNSAVVLRSQAEEEPPAAETSSSRATVNGETTTPSQPEMSQVRSSELTSVPENGALTPRTSSSLNQQGSSVIDPAPGHYWSKPSMDQLRKMSRSELSNVENFVVGRDKIGRIEFNPGKSVDLSGVDLDKLYGDIVHLTVRNATVYGEHTTIPKPARGTGLNHFSRITLGNSWPRNRAGKRDPKHLERLKRVNGTTFVDYLPQSGEWIFTVPHFSSYGLDYDGEQYSDNEDDEEEDDDDSSELSAPPDTPAQLHSSQMTGTPEEDSNASPTQSSPDDTFDFMKGKRSRASVPGGYGDEVAYEENENVMDTNGSPFLGERSVGSLDGQHDADYSEESEFDPDQDQTMAESVSSPVQTTEQQVAKESDSFKETIRPPKSILKNSQILRPTSGTPLKNSLIFDDDWANQLQRTISPKKKDRHALRESQGNVLREPDANVPESSQFMTDQREFTRLDMMKSLFPEEPMGQTSSAKRAGSGIEYPYAKRPKTSRDLDELSADDRQFHSCNKPHFSDIGTLIYGSKANHTLEGGIYPTVQEPISGATKDVRFTKLPTFVDASPQTLNFQKEYTDVSIKNGAPFAQTTYPYFSWLAEAVSIGDAAGIREQQAWALLSLLFDEVDQAPNDMTDEYFQQYKDRYRKDKLSEFWKALVKKDADQDVQAAKTAEEKAIAHLSGYNISNACQALLSGMDLRLATMVAQIGGDATMRDQMTEQLEDWGGNDMLSEMEEPVRALYELLSGNCARSECKASDGRENKVRAFGIAARFGLDWRRAFGLRLWYGTLVDEPIEVAIAQFADALREGYEEVKPVPWFVEKGLDMGWKDPEPDSREDILWGILKLYASSTDYKVPTNIEDVLAPENVSGHPLNARLSFQLFRFFKSRLDELEEGDTRRVEMPTARTTDGLRKSLMSSTALNAGNEEQAADALVELGDKLTITYAASLHTREHWKIALLIYSHVSQPAAREQPMRALLDQFSDTYEPVESDTTYKELVDELKIPAQWIHAAAALQAKSKGNNIQQVTHLIKAGELEAAHEVLCRSVAPDCIISRDYDALRELLGEFLPKPPTGPADELVSTASRAHARRPKEVVQGWSQGGQIYFDYIHLLDLTSHVSSYRIDEQLDNEIKELLSKLQGSLKNVASKQLKGCELEERVALIEIAGVVADLIAKNLQLERSRILELPLTEDLWLRHSLDLSVSYYQAIMAGK